MTYLLIALVVLILGGVIYLANQPGDYLIKRSRLMALPRQVVCDKIRDFKTWQEWSPWLIHEPDTRLQFSEQPDQEGGWYTWDGNHVGAGKLIHEKFVGTDRIEQRIEFTRPFKSVCKVWWELDERNGQTEVSWCMQGRMPFLFRFMTNMTRMMIEKDYDLGLAMLNGVLDPDAERPTITFEGECDREPINALTIPFAGQLEDMVDAMQEGFPRLAEYVSAQDTQPTGRPFSAYHKADPQKLYFECDIAMPVAPEAAPGEFTRKTLPGGRYYEIRLQGSYDFLELCWYSAFAHLRLLKLKHEKSRPSFEVYATDPLNVAHSNEITTLLYLPLK